MSSDLEKFLQQAAERLAQKANASGGRGQAGGRGPGGGQQPKRRPAGSTLPPGGPRRQEPTSQAGGGQRPAPTAEIIEAEVIDGDEARRRALREAGSDPLSTLDTRPALAQTISQADERMGSHLQQVFNHELTQLRAPSADLASGIAARSDATAGVPAKAQPANPIVAMLRNPDSLRAAFIASEIFKRRT
jgi:hypothetical protein